MVEVNFNHYLSPVLLPTHPCAECLCPSIPSEQYPFAIVAAEVKHLKVPVHHPSISGFNQNLSLPALSNIFSPVHDP
jgi:hypothetical protein